MYRRENFGRWRARGRLCLCFDGGGFMASGQRVCGLLLCSLLLFFTGCDSSRTAAKSAAGGKVKWKVACTTGMVADVIRELGGDHVEIQQLMGEGVDPHLYKASPGDVRILESADLVCYSGLHLEGKLADTLTRMAKRKPTCALAEGLPKDRLLTADGDFHDPHVWFDVSLWALTIEPARAALEKLDPAHAAEFQEHAARYTKELATLHEECLTKLASIPKSRRVLVTAHDAFRYFGKAYDIEVKAIQGISTEGEAGVKKVNELVEFISTHQIKSVFTESSVSERNMQSLIEGCAQNQHAVARGGELFSDAMGKAGTPEGTYIGMVRHNVNQIVNGLK